MKGHIPRLREEGILRDFLSGGTKYRLCWITGEKGTGKTETVKSVAGERDDTLYYAIQKWDEEEKALIRKKAKEYRYIILDNADSLFSNGRVSWLKDYVISFKAMDCTLVLVTDAPVIPRTFADGVFLGSDAFLRIHVRGISEGESRMLFPSYDYIDGTLLSAVTGGRVYLYGMLDREISFRDNMKRLYEKRSTLHSYFRDEVEKNAEEYSYILGNTHFYRSPDTAFIFYLWYFYPVKEGVRKYRDADDFWESNREDIYSSFLALAETGGLWTVSSDGRRAVLKENNDGTLTVFDNAGKEKYTEEKLNFLKANSSFLEETGLPLRYSVTSYYGFGEMEKGDNLELVDLSWKRILGNTKAVLFDDVWYALRSAGWTYASSGTTERGITPYTWVNDNGEAVLLFRNGKLLSV